MRVAIRTGRAVAKPVDKLAVEQFNSAIVYKLPYGAFAFESPTGNCQMFSISGFNMLLSTLKDEEIHALIDKLAENIFDKYVMLIDVDQSYKSRIKKLYPYGILSSAPYVSTNESDMIVVVIKVREPEEDDDDYDEYD